MNFPRFNAFQQFNHLMTRRDEKHEKKKVMWHSVRHAATAACFVCTKFCLYVDVCEREFIHSFFEINPTRKQHSAIKIGLEFMVREENLRFWVEKRWANDENLEFTLNFAGKSYFWYDFGTISSKFKNIFILSKVKYAFGTNLERFPMNRSKIVLKVRFAHTV